MRHAADPIYARRMTESEPAEQVILPAGIGRTIEPGTPVIGVRDYIASQHLYTARREAPLCRKREDQLLNDDNLDRRHRSHAITAVFSAVAFLEAFINATWQDAAHREHTAYTNGIPEGALATMGELWNGKDQAERMLSLLSKFQVALVCAGYERMDEGAEPFQSADVIVDLRNVLVHFKPQWHWSNEDLKFERRLKSLIRPESENRQPIGYPWFPNKALGAGCADWACKTSIDFARTWHDRIGLASDFDELYLMGPQKNFRGGIIPTSAVGGSANKKRAPVTER